MREKSTKPASSYLNPNSRELTTVLSKANAIEQLNRKLADLLDPAVRKYCRVANLTNGVLVVLTANGSVAAKMRYLAGDLVKSLRKDHALSHIREIQFKVSPAGSAPYERPVDQKKHREPAELLSAETAETLMGMASTIEDPRLRAALEKIARNKK